MADIREETLQINRDFEERQAKANGEALGLGYINVAQVPINPDVLPCIPQEVAGKLKIMPFDLNGTYLKVATVFPQDPSVRQYLETLAEKYTVTPFICSETSFLHAFPLYESGIANKKTIETRSEFEEHHRSLSQQREKIKALEASIPKIQTEVALNEILLLALENQASDIHIQPHLGEVKLRFRMNGILQDILTIPLEVAARIVSRIKYESGTKSNIVDIPQDGRMGLEANGRKIDIRVSVIPTETIESITLRVLDMNKSIRDFQSLGFGASEVLLMEKMLQEPSGMILITGPTGSGKTTTLYTMLHKLNTPDRKLVTLEDPIEYHLPNVTQSQINPNKAYDFEMGLKAMLRHDPDVILIGEIRDFETAKLATEASQTGHLVLSSLHTNSAIGAISRLRNLGLANFNIASSLKMIIGQRLVRTLCDHCKKPVPLQLSEEEKKIVEHYQMSIPETIYQPGCCGECGETGYKARTTVSEILLMDERLSGLVTADHPEHEIREIIGKETKYRPLLLDGFQKVFEGKTTFEELYRVVSLWGTAEN